MSYEQLIPYILGIIGAIGVITTIWWRFRREKPILNIEILSCEHKVRSDHKVTNVKLEFRVHNTGDKDTTLTKLGISFLDWKGNPHTKAENFKIDVEANKSTENLDVLYTFSPTFQYAESFPCQFILHHTHGKRTFEVVSQESSEDLSRRPAVNAWKFG